MMSDDETEDGCRPLGALHTLAVTVEKLVSGSEARDNPASLMDSVDSAKFILNREGSAGFSPSDIDAAIGIARACFQVCLEVSGDADRRSACEAELKSLFARAKELLGVVAKRSAHQDKVGLCCVRAGHSIV